MTTPTTQLRGPWPIAQKPATKQQHRMREPIPLDKLAITEDPPPLRKSSPGGHYEPIFRDLKLGQRIVCPPDRAHALANTLKDWLKKRGIAARVRSCERYPKDGLGGVWAMPVQESEKPKKGAKP